MSANGMSMQQGRLQPAQQAGPQCHHSIPAYKPSPVLQQARRSAQSLEARRQPGHQLICAAKKAPAAAEAPQGPLEGEVLGEDEAGPEESEQDREVPAVSVSMEELDDGLYRLHISVPPDITRGLYENSMDVRAKDLEEQAEREQQRLEARSGGKQDAAADDEDEDDPNLTDEEFEDAFWDDLKMLTTSEAWDEVGEAGRLIAGSFQYSDEKRSLEEPYTYTAEAVCLPDLEWSTPHHQLQLELIEVSSENIAEVASMIIQELRDAGEPEPQEESELLALAEQRALAFAEMHNKQVITGAVADAIVLDIPDSDVETAVRPLWEERTKSVVAPEEVEASTSDENFKAYMEENGDTERAVLRGLYGLSDLARIEKLEPTDEQYEEAAQEAVSEGAEDSIELRRFLHLEIMRRLAQGWLFTHGKVSHVQMDLGEWNIWPPDAYEDEVESDQERTLQPDAQPAG